MDNNHPHRLAYVDDVNRFMFAGNATLTLVSTKTGARFTYKIKASDDGRVHFVSLMNGTDNECSFHYLGHFRGGAYTHGRKSRIGEDATSAKAFKWFAENYHLDGALGLVEVWHEGTCGRCGRKLTVPESIATGIGPECASQMGIERVARPKVQRPKKTTQAELRRAEAAQSPDGKPAVGSSNVLPFPNDIDWVRKFATVGL